MKLIILTLFSVTLIAASKDDKNVSDVVTGESGHKERLPDTNYKGSSGQGGYLDYGGYPGRAGYSGPLDDKERAKYTETVEYAYGGGNNREKQFVVDEIAYGYGPQNIEAGKGQAIFEDGKGGRGGYNGDYIEGYPNGYDNGAAGYRNRFPDYKYRSYGRDGLGFDKRTGYALGLRYPLTPMLLQTLYRHNYHEDKHDSLGNMGGYKN